MADREEYSAARVEDDSVYTPEPGTILYAYDFFRKRLVSFDASNPSVYLSDVALNFPPTTFFTPSIHNENFFMGIDFRPTDGRLYGVMSEGFPSPGRIVTIDTVSGNITTASGSSPSFLDLFAGFDFDPTGAFIRFTGNARTNRRINPDSGQVIAADTTLAYASGDQNQNVAPMIVQAAYDFPTSGGATLYGIDSVTDSLVRIGGVGGVPSANTGQLTTIGPLGINPTNFGGFDIQQGTNTAYAALFLSSIPKLVRIDLTTGRADVIGTIGDGEGVIDGLAIPMIWSPAPTSGPAQTPVTPGVRTLRTINARGWEGQYINVPLEFTAIGGESAIDLSVKFPTELLTFDSALLDAGALPGTSLALNIVDRRQGTVGVSLRSPGTYSAGGHRVMNFRFRINPGIPGNLARLAITKDGTRSSVYDALGNELEVNYQNSTVEIDSNVLPVAAFAGTVKSQDGRPIPGAVVTFSNSTGVIKSVRASSFGTYSVSFGVAGSLVVKASSNRYTFTPKVVYPDFVNTVNLIGTPNTN